jgi:transcriptional repressor NrdR
MLGVTSLSAQYIGVKSVKCPSCGYEEDKVIDSRSIKDGMVTRRRRECLNCSHRYTTYEYIEPAQLMVIKRSGNREEFQREKILRGITNACGKLPIPRENIEETTDNVVNELRSEFRNEIPSSEIGERVMKHLRELDEVAYVRFASVYRKFEDITEFMDELRTLVKEAKTNREVSAPGG